MKILLTGGTGFVGRALVASLVARGDEVTVLSRKQARRPEAPPAGARVALWDPEQDGAWDEELSRADAVVNLAGEPVAQRWTPEAKERIVRSRVASTRRLVAAIGRAQPRPRVLVNASAIGYYGPRPASEALDESSPAGEGFLAEVVTQWEEAARGVEAHGVRGVQVRLGVVLGDGGGALDKMILPFKLFGGGPLGSGEQVISWIHRDDACGILRLAVDDARAEGPLNAVAPHPVSARELASALGAVLGRPSWFRTPEAAIRLAMGEAAEIVTAGQRVLPARALALGYGFVRPELEGALASILG